MAIVRHTDILDLTIDSSVIPHIREYGEKAEIIDLGTSAITPFFILGRLSTTGVIAKYKDTLSHQELYAILESYNETTKECKLIKNGVAVMDKLSMLTAADAEITATVANLTALKITTLDYSLRAINIDTI